MTAWMNLLVKELKLGRKFFFGGLIVMALIALIAIGFAAYYPYGISSMLFFAGCAMLVFYVFVYLIVSFSNERNSFSTWMQMPLPGWSLIAAKVVAGFISMLVTIVAAFILLSLVMGFDGSPDFSGILNNEAFELTESDKEDIRMGEEIIRFLNEHYFDLLLKLTPMLLGGAALLGGAYLIFYFTHKTVQRWVGRWSILVAIMIVILVLRIYDLIVQSPMIQWFDWGKLPISDTFIEVGGNRVDIFLESMSLGHLLLDVTLVGLVVLTCGWLLDKKVEVQ